MLKKGRWEYTDGQVNKNKDRAEDNNGAAIATTRHGSNQKKQEIREDMENETCLICRKPVGSHPGSSFTHINLEHFRPKWGTFSIERYRRLHEVTNVKLRMDNLDDPFQEEASELY